MSNPGFGRRNVPQQRVTASRKRGEAADEDVHPDEAVSDVGPVQIAVCAGAALILAFCVIGIIHSGRFAVGQAEPPKASERSAMATPAVEPAPAVVAVAQRQAGSPVGADTVGKDRLDEAVSAFFGFYHVNSRSRVEHCAKLGVDITAFADRFKRKQSAVYERATAAARQSGLTEDRLWTLSRGSLASMVAADMVGAEEKLKSGADGACKAMNEYAEQFVDNLDFKTIQPAAHGVLMGS